MPEILFTHTRTTRANPPETFEAGAVYDLPQLSVNRWLVRGVATTDPDMIAAAKAGAKGGAATKNASAPQAAKTVQQQAGEGQPVTGDYAAMHRGGGRWQVQHKDGTAQHDGWLNGAEAKKLANDLNSPSDKDADASAGQDGTSPSGGDETPEGGVA